MRSNFKRERCDAVLETFYKGGERVKNRILLILLAMVFVLGLGLAACTGEEEEEGPANDKVYIFAARPLTGSLIAIGNYAFGPIMDFWQDKVNRAGGINVGGTIGTVR